jgi:hypothetical protein
VISLAFSKLGLFSIVTENIGPCKPLGRFQPRLERHLPRTRLLEKSGGPIKTLRQGSGARYCYPRQECLGMLGCSFFAAVAKTKDRHPAKNENAAHPSRDRRRS